MLYISPGKFITENLTVHGEDNEEGEKDFLPMLG